MRERPTLQPDWTLLHPDEFDRLVEALLKRHHADADRVWSPNDSGGDGGRDMVVVYTDRTLIYQFKFFPDGLTSKPDSRKSQLRKSFIAAAQHQPDEWILIFPGKINDTMDAYVRGLPKDKRVLQKAPDAQKIAVDIWDRTDLDTHLAPHRDLLNLLDTDRVLEAAKVLNQERALLAGGLTDALNRQADLQDLVDGLDPDWTADLSTVNGLPVAFVRAKHPHVKPISITANLVVPVADIGVREAIKDVVLLGGRGSVDIPGEYVTITDLKGPKAFQFGGTLSSLRIEHKDGIESLNGKPLHLDVTGKDGSTLQRATGQVTFAGIGSQAVTIEGLFSGGAHVTLRLPFEEGAATDFDMQLRAVGLSPGAVAQSASLLAAMARGSQIAIALDGNAVAKGALSDGDTEYARHLQGLADSAADLAAIQWATSTSFPMPHEDISGEDRVWLRALRIVHEGGLVAIPRRVFGIHAHPNVPEADWPRDGEFKSVLFGWPSDEIEVLGTRIPIPPVWVVCPKTQIDGFAEAARGATDGVPNPRMFTVTAAEDASFLMYRLDGGLKDTSGRPAPWSLPEIEEPPVLPLTFADGDD